MERFFFVHLLLLGFAPAFFQNNQVIAQTKSQHDSNYFAIYPQQITTRFYFSQKYTSFTAKASGKAKDIAYRPNTTLNMGIGATYKNISLNLAAGFGFLNKDTEKGKTKYLDLQAHMYPRKWAIDFFGQLYTGYFLKPKGFASGNQDIYYQRPDLNVKHFGLSAFRILNHKKFSYNAALIQNEWQKKSAGSFLFGAEIYYANIQGDSALVPSTLNNNYPQAGINKLSFFSFGPGIGYAYTLVLQHLFLTASVTGNLNLGFSTETDVYNKEKMTYIKPTTLFRLGAGYNSSTWNLSVNWIHSSVPFRGASTPRGYLVETGNYRLILAKKITPGKKVKKLLAPIERIFK